MNEAFKDWLQNQNVSEDEYCNMTAFQRIVVKFLFDTVDESRRPISRGIPRAIPRALSGVAEGLENMSIDDSFAPNRTTGNQNMSVVSENQVLHVDLSNKTSMEEVIRALGRNCETLERFLNGIQNNLGAMTSLIDQLNDGGLMLNDKLWRKPFESARERISYGGKSKKTVFWLLKFHILVAPREQELEAEMRDYRQGYAEYNLEKMPGANE